MPLPDRPAPRTAILVAEDNQTNQEVILAMLGQLGHDARAVSDGAQAVEALRAADFDLVLMDCWMPDMDGYEATRLIRNPETGVRNHRIPIVALTADAMPNVRQDCILAGMNDYLTKPVDLRELRRTLEKWLHPTKPAFDRQDLLDRLMGNADLAHRIIRRFVSDAPAQLAALAEAVNRADAESVRAGAHAIKGAAANAGAARLSEAVRRLEAASLSGAGELVSSLPQLFEEYRLQTEKLDSG